MGLGLAGPSSSVSKTIPWIRVTLAVNLLLGPLLWENGEDGESVSEFSHIHTMKYHRKLFSFFVLFNETNLVFENSVI